MAKVLHASASGYFPGCLVENADIANQSLVDAMAIYWKVKSWTITISGDDPISATTFTRTESDETYLVCNNNEFSPSDADNFFSLSSAFYVNSYSNPTLYGVRANFYLKRGSLIYSSQGGEEFSQLVGTFSFYGNSYPLYREIDEGGPPSASGSIVPDTYWPYTA